MMPPIFNRSLSILLLLLAIITHQGLGQSQAQFQHTSCRVSEQKTSDPAIDVYTSYKASLSTITASVAASSTVVQAAGVTYAITFTPDNNIPSNGVIRVSIPLAITANLSAINSTSCLAGTTVLATVNCGSATNSTLSLINFTIPSGATAGTSFSVQVQSIFTNPISTEPVSSFTIETFS